MAQGINYGGGISPVSQVGKVGYGENAVFISEGVIAGASSVGAGDGGGGGGTPGGTNLQLQYNNNGAFGGSGITVAPDTNSLLVSNGLVVGSLNPAHISQYAGQLVITGPDSGVTFEDANGGASVVYLYYSNTGGFTILGQDKLTIGPNGYGIEVGSPTKTGAYQPGDLNVHGRIMHNGVVIPGSLAADLEALRARVDDLERRIAAFEAIGG